MWSANGFIKGIFTPQLGTGLSAVQVWGRKLGVLSIWQRYIESSKMCVYFIFFFFVILFNRRSVSFIKTVV